MKKIAILCVTNDIVSDQRVARTASVFLDEGWQVRVVGRVHSKSPQKSEFPFETKRFRMLAEGGKWFYFFFNLRLFFYLLFAKSDLIFSNDLDTLPACFFASKIRGKKLIYDSHELFTEVPELQNRPGTKAIWEKIERFFLPRLKSMITVNDSLAKIFSEKYIIPVSVVRNVPVKRVLEDVPRDPNILLYQGAVNKGRGLELLIQAMKFLPGYRLVIAGRGDLSDELKQSVKNSGLEQQIEFKGHLDAGELFRLTQTAMLGFSLEEDLGLNYRYALPNKIFDYMMAGTPQVVSDLPEMAAVVSKAETGIILKPEARDPKILAEKIKSMLEDQTSWIRMQENCLKAREEFCWEKEREVLQDLVRKAFSPGKP